MSNEKKRPGPQYLSSAIDLGGRWDMVCIKNSEWLKRFFGKEPESLSSSVFADCQRNEAQVPGNFELDLYRDGKEPDPFFGTNIVAMQKYESCHFIYIHRFILEGEAAGYRLFADGIDTVADIYLNGVFVGHSEDMLVEYDYPAAGLRNGVNEILVHISPAMIESRKYIQDGFEICGHSYGDASLRLRKAPHMFGWDIAPRAVSGGIWRDIYLGRPKTEYIRSVFPITRSADMEAGRGEFVFRYDTHIDGDDIMDYSIAVSGVCGDSAFEAQRRLWGTSGEIGVAVENAKFWLPRNYGDPNLYDVSVTLRNRGEVIDEYKLRAGLRTVELERTSTIADGGGDFRFIINGCQVFVLGTNWVPLDAYHSNDKNRLPQALEMLDDIGCNAVRCWGGNVYESDDFFDFCDSHGIMVWQDFALACCVPPQDEAFCEVMRAEAEKVVRRLRVHPSLILWSGDNECDDACLGRGLDPNDNVITRRVLREAARIYDGTRPYLPSSPYRDEVSFATGVVPPEGHIWGPRDWFKGPFYKDAPYVFASETGYHGCPSYESLQKFISKEKIFDLDSDEMLVHAANPEGDAHAQYAYRNRLMYGQSVTMFGREFPFADETDGQERERLFIEFVKASQISQAEAFKYFIERFRIRMGKKSGIIWWNLLDCQPQISDAVVDYYFTKKLAYFYIRRCQTPFCLMFDEPGDDGRNGLYAVNDTGEEKQCGYTVKDLVTGESVASGTADVPPRSSCLLFSASLGSHRFFSINWTAGSEKGENHYVSDIKGVDLYEYCTALASVVSGYMK